MVSRRSIVVLVILALTAGSHVNAQVRPLGAVGQKGEVRQASCYSDCGPMDCGGNCGTVWGATCMDPCNYHPGLYAPCPNPCRTTLVGELLLDVKHAVCTSLSHIFCCTFGNCGLATCGRCGPCIESYDCCSGCDSCVGGTYVDGCAGCGTTTSDCGCQGGSMQVSPLEVGQPAPAGVNPQNNPFRDDPNPQGTGAMGVQQTTRTRSILPAPRAATQRPTRTARSDVPATRKRSWTRFPRPDDLPDLARRPAPRRRRDGVPYRSIPPHCGERTGRSYSRFRKRPTGDRPSDFGTCPSLLTGTGDERRFQHREGEAPAEPGLFASSVHRSLALPNHGFEMQL